MANRIIKWIAFSIGLTILPIILSLIFHLTFNIEIQFSDYTSEFLFMAVTLAATSIGDVFELIHKGINGIHITVIFVSLIFISLVCISIYEMQNIGSALEISINPTMINILTVIGCISSLGIGIACQVFLERIEGSSP
ncbi:MAG: hypothetical protein NC177_01555 [Ruminococcus flavefaciens]|nr:hypothetical protein [Ruminococcus flavefaciens]